MKGRTDIQRRTEREKNERGNGLFVFLILISHLLHYTTLYLFHVEYLHSFQQVYRGGLNKKIKNRKIENNEETKN